MSRPLRNKEASRLLSSSRSAALQLSKASYAMCGVIFRLAAATVKKGGEVIPLFRDRGFSTWLELVDHVCGINASDAGRMRAVWQFFEIDVKWDRRLALPSWRKMYLVSRLADGTTVNRLLKHAASTSVMDLEQEVRDLRARLADPDEPARGEYNFHAVLRDKTKIDSVMQAIEFMHREHGIRSHGEALFHLSFHFNMNSRKRRLRAA